MWTPDVTGRDAQTHGKVGRLLCIQAIKVCFVNFISKAVTLGEFSAPPLSTKDKNRYRKMVRNQRENWEGGVRTIIMLDVI